MPAVIVHGSFLKMVSQESVKGRMAAVTSISICRCGKRFQTDGQLEAHLRQPASTPIPASITSEPEEHSHL